MRRLRVTVYTFYSIAVRDSVSGDMDVVGMAARAHPACEQKIACFLRREFVNQIVTLYKCQMPLLLAAGISPPPKTGNFDCGTAAFRFGVIRNTDDSLCRDACPERDCSCP